MSSKQNFSFSLDSLRNLKRELFVAILAFSVVSFLITFPNFGPISSVLISYHKTEAIKFYTIFFIFHITGIITGMALVNKLSRKLLTTISVMLTLLFSILSCKFYVAISGVGFFLGILMVLLGCAIYTVAPWRRGVVVGSSVAASNIVLLFVVFTEFEKFSIFNIVLLSTLLLIPAIFVSGRIWKEKKINRFKDSKLSLNDLWKTIIAISFFYILGGIMYNVMEPFFKNIGVYNHITAYVIAAFVSGIMYDYVGRRIISISGIILLALAYLLFPRIPVASAYIIQASYGFIDVFSMLIWSDISPPGKEGFYYGIGFNSIVSSLFIGYTLPFFTSYSIRDFVDIALMALVISSILIALTKEPKLSPIEYAERVKFFKNLK